MSIDYNMKNDTFLVGTKNSCIIEVAASQQGQDNACIFVQGHFAAEQVSSVVDSQGIALGP